MEDGACELKVAAKDCDPSFSSFEIKGEGKYLGFVSKLLLVIESFHSPISTTSSILLWM